jgi:hypothetical protein
MQTECSGQQPIGDGGARLAPEAYIEKRGVDLFV